MENNVFWHLLSPDHNIFWQFNKTRLTQSWWWNETLGSTLIQLKRDWYTYITAIYTCIYNHTYDFIYTWSKHPSLQLSSHASLVRQWNRLRALGWRHNGHDCVSNHQPHDCLLNRLFGRRSHKLKAPRHWPLCGEFTGDRWIHRTNGQ